MINSNIYEKITAEKNIYVAICAARYFIQEQNILDPNDYIELQKLNDKFDFEHINKLILECKNRINDILTHKNKYFDAEILLKFKKKENEKNEFRPIYTASLIDQICIIAIASQIIFDDDFSNDTRDFSDLTKCLPKNFYGNMPTLEVSRIFYDWHDKYAEYTDITTKKIKTYKENKKYKYKIALDLENFFPSINITTLKNLILDKLFSKDEKDNREIYRTILDKLFKFNIKNVDDIKSINVHRENIKQELNKFYNIGLPQGLPHTYYFANIVMIEIANIIKESQPKSEAFYYVDDSIIFTNIDDDSAPQDFLNNLIMKINNKIEDKKLGCNLNTNKSNIEKIDDINENLLYAKSLTQLTSVCNNEMFNTTSAEEDNILKSKIEAILDFIKQEMSDPSNSENTEYLKKLHSLKKYYSLRQQILESRLTSDYDEYLNPDNIFKKIYSEPEVNKVLEETSFYGSINYFLPLINKKDDFIELIKEKYNDFIKEDNIPEEVNYFNRFTSNLSSTKYNDTPNTLINLARNTTLLPINYYEEGKRNCIQELFPQMFQYNSKFLKQLFGKNLKIIRFIYKLSLSYKKEIFNTIFSHILGFPLDQYKMTQKSNGRKMYIYELLLLVYLRSPYSNEIMLKNISKEIESNIFFDNENLQQIDYQILEVINTFFIYVKNPDYIRNLIIAHRYTTFKWQNGSKFLYFYTLHNQDHAIKLINNSVQIVRSINLIQLNPEEWFLLFMSCYLHDIAMTLYPDLDALSIEQLNLEKHAEELFAQIDDINKFKSKLIEIFKLVDSSIENYIRKNHEPNSAKMIVDDTNLRLYGEHTKFLKEQIAIVSKSHGEDGILIYNEKVPDSKINLKFTKIVLRIADLLDTDKTRVNPVFLDDNLNTMPDISKFHWYSHAIVNSCNIISNYKYEEQVLKEEIHININLNYYTKIKDTCTQIKKLNKFTEKDGFYLKFDGKHSNKECDCSECTLMCKWLCKKNEWLYNEMNLLATYLNRVTQPFKSVIYINYKYENPHKKTNNYYPFIHNYLNS